MSDAQKLKVFISWSGPLSRGVALALRDWLPIIFDNVSPWASETDIEPGQRGLKQIEIELTGSAFGLIILTKENQHSPWLNFEAGALSKTIAAEAESRVVPLLVDISSPSQVTGPIAQFQMKQLDKEGLSSVLTSLGALVGVEAAVVATRLGKNWDDLSAQIAAVQSSASADASPQARGPEDMLEEILTHVRSIRSDSFMWNGKFRPQAPGNSVERVVSEGVVALARDVCTRQFNAAPDEVQLVYEGIGDSQRLRMTVWMPIDFPTSHTNDLVMAITEATGVPTAVAYAGNRLQ
jgi:hypothetical protein